MEYAPEYTRREKITRISMHVLVGIAGYVGVQYYLLPFIQALAEQPYCYDYWGMNGAQTVWLILLCGIPSLFALLLFLFLFPIGFRSWRDKQFPPRGMKVYRPTRIQYGLLGRIRTWVAMIVPVVVLAAAVWGGLQAQGMHFEKADVATTEELAACPTIQ